jgi:hypothetical protein
MTQGIGFLKLGSINLLMTFPKSRKRSLFLALKLKIIFMSFMNPVIDANSLKRLSLFFCYFDIRFAWVKIDFVFA